MDGGPRRIPGPCGPGGPIDGFLGRGRIGIPFPFGIPLGIGRGGPWADMRGIGDGVADGDPGCGGAANKASTFGRFRLTRLRL
jgi:hypothetical protein